MSKARSGGGITMNKNTRTSVRSGPASTNKINPKGAAQIGAALDPKAVERVKAGTAPAVPLGNQLATNVGKGGPGTGRTVMRAGSQGMHGAPATGNPPPTGELFPGWPAKGRG
jgi:hypothetical protein